MVYAQQNSFDIQQAVLNKSKAVVQVKNVKNIFLPTLDARVRTAGNWGFLIDPSTNELSNQFNFGNQGSLNFNLDLVDGFATSNLVKLRKQEAATANYGYQVSSNNVLLGVTYAFLQVLLAQEQLLNSRQRAAFLDKQARKVKAQVERGALSGRDLLNIQSQIASEDLLTVYAENDVEKSLFNLKQVIGLPIQENLGIETIEIADVLPAADLTIDEVLNTSLAVLPDLQVAQTKIDATRYLWQIERASYKPTVSLIAQVATRTSNYKAEAISSQVRDNLNRQIGVALYVPIFNRFQLRTIDHLAKLDLQAAKLAYKQVDRDLRAKVVGAFLDYRAAAKKYRALQFQHKVIAEEYRYAEKMLELGGIDAVEYSLTRGRLVNAQSEVVQAKYDCYFKRKIIDFFQGKPLYFTE